MGPRFPAEIIQGTAAFQPLEAGSLDSSNVPKRRLVAPRIVTRQKITQAGAYLGAELIVAVTGNRR